jgi:hypothetical protein
MLILRYTYGAYSMVNPEVNIFENVSPHSPQCCGFGTSGRSRSRYTEVSAPAPAPGQTKLVN